MKFDIAKIELILEQGLAFIQQFAPLAALGGPAAAAIGAAVAQVAAAAGAIIAAIEADITIIGGGDTTKIKALQAQIQAENNVLRQAVDGS